MLTQKRLKELFYYDPETGKFIRRVSRGGAKKGSIAGHLSAGGYLQIRIDGRIYYAHRLTFLYMLGQFPKNQVGHEKGIKTDNRWAKLKDLTPLENSKNRLMLSNNTSGVMGVYWYAPNNKWCAKIRVNGILKHLGYFVELEGAIKAREEANIKYGFHENHGRK
jgi:hypothetical protein